MTKEEIIAAIKVRQAVSNTVLGLVAQESVAMADYMAIVEKYAFLKASQRTCVGLTDEEIEIIYAECNVWDKFEYDRMLKAKLKDKNTRGQE